jgi:hypothetical protein
MIKKIIPVLISTFVLIGCNTTQKKIQVYGADNSINTATITFENADPFIYKNKKPTDASIAIIRWVPGLYNNLSVKVYDDEKNCVDYKKIPVDLKNNGPKKVEAGKMMSFEVTTYESTDKKFVRCFNRFSFTPKPNKEYSIKNSIFSVDVEYAQCRIQVFEGGAEENIIDIVPREKEPTFWTQSSPRCDKSELVNPKLSKESFRTFKCAMKVGGRAC